MMWEILGWISAGCLALILIALTISILVATVRGIIKPGGSSATRTGDVTIFRSVDFGDPAEAGRNIGSAFRGSI